MGGLTVDRGGDNHAKPNRDRPHDNGQRDIFFLNQLIPQVIWSEPIDDKETQTEYD
jgi:hypothetical protein